jgi:hypothetical protein
MYHNRIKDDPKIGEGPKTMGDVRGLTILRKAETGRA